MGNFEKNLLFMENFEKKKNYEKLPLREIKKKSFLLDNFKNVLSVKKFRKKMFLPIFFSIFCCRKF